MRVKTIVAVGMTAAVMPATASAATTAQLQADVSAAMPNANAQVAAAHMQGPAALAALEQQVQSMPMPAPNQTSVQQYALLQALAPYATGSEEQVVAPDPLSTTLTSFSTRCWHQGGHIGDRWNFYQAGIKVGWAEKDHGYWCGNGTSITQNGLAGYSRQTWTPSPSPFCITTPFTNNAWDAPNHGWAHGGLKANWGDYTSWISCATVLSGKVNVRIEATGHSDYYWDW